MNIELEGLLGVLKRADLIYKQEMGLAGDQTCLRHFVKGGGESLIHKKMKQIVVSRLLDEGNDPRNILVDRIVPGKRGFRPDVTLMEGKNMVFFECHHHDNWKNGVYSNIESLSDVRIAMCLKTRRKNWSRYIRKHRILRNANEIWLIDIANERISEIIKNLS